MNYFGLQRIGRYDGSGKRCDGSGQMPYHVGAAMIRGDFALAVKLLMIGQGEHRYTCVCVCMYVYI